MIVAVLDWEMSTRGDPLTDLGTALCCWVYSGDPDPMRMFRMGPTTEPGNLTRVDFVERYAKGSGRDVSSIVPIWPAVVP